MRHEFTWLARTYIAENDNADARALGERETNIERAKLFQMLAINRPDLTLTNATDNLALQRVRPALLNARQEVTNIAEILTREFTRLYRKRNMVVHGGQIRGAYLHSISETLTPLIGAGIDRSFTPNCNSASLQSNCQRWPKPGSNTSDHPNPVPAAVCSICWNIQFHRPETSGSYPISTWRHSGGCRSKVSPLAASQQTNDSPRVRIGRPLFPAVLGLVDTQPLDRHL
jgi:hypothetical protein